MASTDVQVDVSHILLYTVADIRYELFQSSCRNYIWQMI